jgi:hypothetical protein
MAAVALSLPQGARRDTRQALAHSPRPLLHEFVVLCFHGSPVETKGMRFALLLRDSSEFTVLESHRSLLTSFVCLKIELVLLNDSESNRFRLPGLSVCPHRLLFFLQRSLTARHSAHYSIAAGASQQEAIFGQRTGLLPMRSPSTSFRLLEQ